MERLTYCVVALCCLCAGAPSPSNAQLMADVTITVGMDGYIAFADDGHGPGGIFTDLDNDHFPDLFLSGGGPTLPNPLLFTNLYLNVSSPSGRVFQQVPQAAGGGGLPDPVNGAIAGDFDNDGDRDIYTVAFGDNTLLRNELIPGGQVTFTDVTASTDPTPMVPDDQFGVRLAKEFAGPIEIDLINSLTAAWADVDRDGDLDLFVGNHYGYWDELSMTWIAVAPGDKAGQRDTLYLNNLVETGVATFTDVTPTLGGSGFETATGAIETPYQRYSSTNAAIFADFNNDRWPDLLVTNKVSGVTDRDLLYLNQGDDATGAWLGFQAATYTLTDAAGTNVPFGDWSPGAMGVDVADADNDGDLDIYITDISATEATIADIRALMEEQGFSDEKKARIEAAITQLFNDLWINQLNETGSLHFIHNTTLFPAAWSWGTQWQDFDNNGWQDLHVATNAGLTDFLYLILPTSLADQAGPLGVAQTRDSRTSLTADYNRDGWTDLFVVNTDLLNGPSVLYENRLGPLLPFHHHLSVLLVGDPSLPGPFKSSRDAIGARVILTAGLNGNGQIDPLERLSREVVSGSSNAASSSSLDLEFGMGLATQGTLEILWPSGRLDVLAVTADQCLEIRETADVAEVVAHLHP